MSTVDDRSSPDRSPPLLGVRNLTKRYGSDGTAIDGVTFSAVAGEVLGIIGPNGAGKTTLLESIAGLLPVNSGNVFWHGEPLHAGRRRDVLFYLPDGVRPYQDQSALQVVSFVGDVFRRSDADIKSTIEALGLQPVLRKRVHALSKGYARRLMLTIGLLAPHELLLMDEPFDGFDLRQTRDVMGVLRRQTARGRTLILSIHQLQDAERVCDRFILLSAGQVRGSGGLAELRAQTRLPNGSLEDIFLALT
ncbi:MULTISPECIES: ABC transporter ATP-binding protein [unclassified Bradyrhizobium]|uniref:ABC transporter ATP-binding protein n=1 Tax=unclassified Bradyrhizobium TaxID=2631580 RepID=UPI00247A6487|nr:MULTISPECIES: ABC transporter ATP-binding protein [unclassified Bradyrhizobium]WGR73928.1 ABC transporter ATP-binding protein [Bradyrhizobium sp. ISRA426]WGR78765.1 ABC transporter ATP-binding protein [Bradyrhizobium sp. ISRA430]WGR89167.1 ABC transporter ATP-binding protein [Bradyrhizobium sp. ISRA432]